MAKYSRRGFLKELAKLTVVVPAVGSELLNSKEKLEPAVIDPTVRETTVFAGNRGMMSGSSEVWERVVRECFLIPYTEWHEKSDKLR